jgi:hypothetical protein
VVTPAAILRDQLARLYRIRTHTRHIYEREVTLSDLIEIMVDDLETSEVQNLVQ